MDFAPPPLLPLGVSSWNFVLPHDEAAAADARSREWESSLRPNDAFEVFLVQQIGVHATRLERCQNEERSIRSRRARRAGLCWDEDRGLAAEVLGATLPKSPEIVTRRLRATKQGCDWLIGRWEALRGVLGEKGEWDEAQETLAMDLLGLPAELRDGSTALAGGPEALALLMRDEIDRLWAFRAGALDELDAHDRVAAEAGFGPDPEGQLAALHRFERTCARRLEWARNQLRARPNLPRHDPGPGGRRPETPPAPAAAEPSLEEQWQAATRAIEARKRARLAAESVPEPTPSPLPDAVPTPGPIQDLPQPTRPFPTARCLRALLAIDKAPSNRRSRRARAAAAARRA